MSNLPLSGSTFWGSGINNYLRQLETEVQDLRTQLRNFSVSVSYSGSGFGKGMYDALIPADDPGKTPSDGSPGTEAIEHNAGVFLVNDFTQLQIVGDLVYSNMSTGQTTPTALDRNSDIRMSFNISSTATDKIRTIDTLHYIAAKDHYEVIDRNIPLSTVLSQPGFYPVYFVKDPDITYKIAVNPRQEFIFNENYILAGIIKVATDITNAKRMYFIKKSDSARKNIYDTRKGNVENHATIVNGGGESGNGLFNIASNGNLEVLLSTVQVDYQGNGISANKDQATEDDNDYKYPLDFKRFGPAGRKVYKITDKTVGDSTETTEEFKEISLQNITLSSSTTEYNKDKMYGIYITVAGDILIEESGDLSSITDLYNYATSYIWDLNSDSNFRTGGLVLLGSFYYTGGAWNYTVATSNSISPTFLTNKSVENSSFVRWPDITYLAYDKADSGITNVKPYQFKVLVTDQTTGTNYLTLNTGYKTDAHNNYEIPVFPADYYEPNIDNSSGTFNSIQFGNLVIEKTTDNAGTVEIKNNGQAIFETGIRSVAKNDVEGFNNIFSTLYVGGNIKFDAVGTCSIERTVTGLKGISAGGDKGFVIDGNNNNIIVRNSDKPVVIDSEAHALTIKGSNATISSTGDLSLQSTTKITCNKNIEFTSDRRCKKNIQSVNAKKCLDAVRQLDVKTYNYITDNSASIGLIAQDIEEFLPEYKDYLVSVSHTDNLDDKRTVAEIKLNFILWQAVRELAAELEALKNGRH